jgi:chromosome segregation ATPase
LAEQKMDVIKRQLEDDKLTLDNLRHSADSQNEISVLKDQCEKDLDGLEDACREQSYNLQKFNISLPRCRLDNDDNGDELISTMEGVHNDVQTRLDDCEAKLSRAIADRSKTQHILSEKKALLASSQRTLVSHKNKLQGLGQSVAIVEKAVQDLRRFEASKGNTMAVDLENPKELLQYIEARLDELEENNEIISNMPKVVKKFVKHLKKMVSVGCLVFADIISMCLYPMLY